MIVWRYERDGIGPYNHPRAETLGWDLKGAHGDDDHPNPQQEGLDMSSSMVCGMTTAEGLDEWFSGWHGKLKSYRFEVKAYEVDDGYCEVGPSGQVIFLPEEARAVDRESAYAVTG